MSKKEQSSGFPPRQVRSGRRDHHDADQDGDVTVSFSDGSDDLNVSRREFMRISGVAAATAAMSGAACRNPVERIVPYVDRPEESPYRHAQQYATTCDGCSAQCGVLVTTRGGRPVKLEGNPDHPVSKGALCARGQSSYLRPLRPESPAQPARPRETGSTKSRLGYASITRSSTSSSPSLGRKVASPADDDHDGKRAASAHRRCRGDSRLEALQLRSPDSESVANASEHSYGDRHIPHYRFDKADLIVSLGSDFLGTWLSPVEFTKQFSSRRDPEGDMSTSWSPSRATCR